MEDNKLAAEEARRANQHELVKSQVEGEVHAEIAERSAPTRTEAAQVDHVANKFRAKAVNEVVETEREVERARGAAKARPMSSP